MKRREVSIVDPSPLRGLLMDIFRYFQKRKIVTGTVTYSRRPGHRLRTYGCPCCLGYSDSGRSKLPEIKSRARKYARRKLKRLDRDLFNDKS